MTETSVIEILKGVRDVMKMAAVVINEAIAANDTSMLSIAVISIDKYATWLDSIIKQKSQPPRGGN